MSLLQISVVPCLLLGASCTAVNSRVIGEDGTTPDGIPYFLPKRPFVITVSTPYGGGPPSFTVTPGNAEPDLRKEFILSQGTNLLAQNEFNITVASNGLLASSQSTATSQVATAVQNAAATAGMFAAPTLGSVGGAPSVRMFDLTRPKMPEIVQSEQKDGTNLLKDNEVGCPLAGTSFQYILYPEIRWPTLEPLTFICNESSTKYEVTWAREDRLNPPYRKPENFKNNLTEAKAEKGNVSGIFFRHELPYRVVISGKKTGVNGAGPNTESVFVITSPDESETDFFHVTRNFFANNTANITITDGVITAVDQTTQSEVAGLVGLPATYLSNYMTAVGQLFSGLTSVSSNQQKYLQQLQATAATQNQAAAIAAAQYQACRKTVASFNFANMSAAQASAAAAAIQAACGSTNATGTPGSIGTTGSNGN